MIVFDWFVRWRHGLGFGIQSPSAYRFVREVIKGGTASGQGKMCGLLFRLSRFCKAETYVDFCPNSDVFASYVRAVCVGTNVHPTKLTGGKAIVRIPATVEGVKIYSTIIAQITDDSVLVIDGVNASSVGRRFWEAVVTDERTGVTFDLRQLGIAFFDKKVYKRNYKVSF